jgi:hypothetical protein
MSANIYYGGANNWKHPRVELFGFRGSASFALLFQPKLKKARLAMSAVQLRSQSLRGHHYSAFTSCPFSLLTFNGLGMEPPASPAS